MATANPTPIRLVNESALGIYRFSWKSRTGARCEVVWCDDAPLPSFSFFVSGLQRMSDLVKIRNPERFGWAAPPRTRNQGTTARWAQCAPTKRLAHFKAFAERFAQACEEDD